MRPALRLAFLAAAGLALAGCETTTTVSRQGGAPQAAPEPRPAAAPASGESDAARRARARMELAAAYYARGQLDVALDNVKLAIAADPTESAPYNLRGLIYGAMGEPALAEEAFRRALQLDPRDADAMHNFGWFLCERRRYAESLAQFDQALAVPLYREPARTLLAKGVCLAHDKQYGEAERTLARSLQLDPDNPSTAVNLAEVQHRLGQHQRAQATIRRVNARPEVVNAQTLWLAARIERALGNRGALADLGAQLKSRFPNAPETELFESGRFGD